MKLQTIILTAAALCAVSYSSPQGEPTSLYDMFTQERELVADDKTVIIEPVGYASNGEIYDSYLIATMYSSTQIFRRVIDIHTGETIQNILPKGRGRNESTNAYLVGMHRDEVVCYNESKNTILRAPFSEILKPTPYQKWSSQELDWDSELFTSKFFFGALDGGRYVLCGCREEGLFEVIDSECRVLYTFGEYKKLEGDEMERIAPYKGAFYTTPSQERLLYSSSEGNIYYFYDIFDPTAAPRLLNKYHFDTPFIDVKYYDGGGVSMNTNRESIIGTMAVAVSDEYFYMLNDNRRYSEIDASNCGSNTILVFDRNGEPAEKLTLDRKISNIYYSKENNSLYTITLDEEDESCLMRYKLN